MPALLGAGLSVAGTVTQQKQQEKQQREIAEARNQAMRETLVKNKQLAEEGRDTFNKRMSDASAEQMEADQQKAQDTRSDELTEAAAAPADEAAGAAVAPISGSEPELVSGDMARRMKAALGESKEQAKALGRLGSYGDMLLEQNFLDTQAGRDIGTSSNKAAGNSAIMPYAQDFAEQHAYRPISPIGGILQGLGGLVGSYGGSSSANMPRRKYSTPFTG
ncbi:hypothetical protein GGQ64_005339 [Rhizobium azooxidifex]|uniref:Internal virion protein n=1 Tax=Mycoplana azooxidifex TaxID=1636188 RepID=A0A7W6DCC6_9HYPH|nr:hypothetical protein [Mycoplana azooxidifex]